jgi:hypothetical protein
MDAPRPARTEIAVARRLMEYGFLDAAIRLFVRHVVHVTPGDWERLDDRLMERRRQLGPLRV